MTDIDSELSVIIAGASGLVGQSLVEVLLNENNVRAVHALVRRPLPQQSGKLVEHQHSELTLTQWDETTPSPQLGFICLGTTLKEAGSKAALSHVDYDLVCQVAHTMKLIGVKHLAVVSSIGAHPQSPSHYLRCKGKMEHALRGMGFDRLVFVRPGPLSGNRLKPRANEVLSEKILSALGPLLIGPLKNFKPIQANDVAKAMLYSLMLPKSQYSGSCTVLDSRAIWQLIRQFR